MTSKYVVLALALLLVVTPRVQAQQTPAAHQHGTSQAPVPAAPPDDHSAHQSPATPLPPTIPAVTDADRKAAFPDVQGHTVHDRSINYFVLFDQLEWQAGQGGGLSWDNRGWIGKDRNRLWFRTEGATGGDRVEEAQGHALYGRAIARWWDVVAGVRQDLRPGSAQTWAAVGLQGLAPYWFEVQATAYIGGSGRTHVRVETEYELLVTNRLILQPLVEVDVHGKADPSRGIAAGLSSIDAGLRLRYEFRREFAPYLGVVWNRRFLNTAVHARASDREGSGVRLAMGLRLWL